MVQRSRLLSSRGAGGTPLLRQELQVHMHAPCAGWPWPNLPQLCSAQWLHLADQKTESPEGPGHTQDLLIHSGSNPGAGCKAKGGLWVELSGSLLSLLITVGTWASNCTCSASVSLRRIQVLPIFHKKSLKRCEINTLHLCGRSLGSPGKLSQLAVGYRGFCTQ